MYTLGPAFRSSVITDPYFSSVKLLMTGAGADNSTVFTDLSSSAHVLTANANAKVLNNYAAFDGNTDSISTPASSDWNLGADDFTIEFTIDNFVAQHAENPLIGVWSGSTLSWLSTIGSNQLTFYYSTNGTSGIFSVFTNGFTVSTAGGPVHLAITRTSNLVRLFINGVKRHESTLSTTIFNAGSTALYIGGLSYTAASLNGRLKNVRITKGVCRYTADFAPPTTEFPTS